MKKIMLLLAATGLLIVALPAGAHALKGSNSVAHRTTTKKVAKVSKVKVSKSKAVVQRKSKSSRKPKTSKTPKARKPKSSIPIAQHNDNPGDPMTDPLADPNSAADLLTTDPVQAVQDNSSASGPDSGLINQASGQALTPTDDSGAAPKAASSRAKKFAVAGIAGTSALSLLALIKKLFAR